eukprot:gene11539-biopygen7821
MDTGIHTTSFFWLEGGALASTPVRLEVPVPASRRSWVIGRDGSVLKQLRVQFPAVQVHVPGRAAADMKPVLVVVVVVVVFGMVVVVVVCIVVCSGKGPCADAVHNN